jgi:hypothetical protein
MQLATDLADIHAQFLRKLQTASRAAKGDKSLSDLIREAKELELTTLTERATLLDRARDAAVKRFEEERTAVNQQAERLKAEIEELKKAKPPKLETSEGPLPVPQLPWSKKAAEPKPKPRSGDVKGGDNPDR